MAEINISNLGGGGGGTLALTTTGTGGASTYVAGVLNIPVYQTALTNPVTGTGTATRVAFWDSASSVSSSANLYWDNSNSFLGVGTATPGARLQVNGTGLLTATAFAVKDSGGTDSFTVADNGNASVRGVLTISGSSASNSATLMGRTSTGEVASVTLGTNLSFSGNTLNATSGGITSLNGLTAASQSLVTGTAGADFNISSATSTHTFNLPTASATNRGALSSADWTTFNNKQNAITNPVTGTGTATRVAFWDTASSVSSSANLYWDNTNSRLGIGTTTPGARLQVNGTGLLTATAFAVKDSGGTDSFTVADNGNASVRGVLTVTGSSASNATTLMGRTVSGEVASISLGTNLSFSGNTLNATGGGGGSPAGSTGEVQFNNAGAFAASSNLFWDNTNSRLGLLTSGPLSTIHINGGRLAVTRTGGAIPNVPSAIRILATDNTDAYFGAALENGVTAYIEAYNGVGYVDCYQYVTNSAIPLGIGLNASEIRFSTSATGEKARITTAGNFVIGTTTASARLHVRGSSATGGTNAFLVQSGGGSPSTLFQVQNDGATTLNGTLAQNGTVTMSDGSNIAVGATNGTKIGTATTQKIGFYNATPIVRPDTNVAASAFVAGTGTAVNDNSTFGGYTIKQVVQALQNLGLLA